MSNCKLSSWLGLVLVLAVLALSLWTAIGRHTYGTIDAALHSADSLLSAGQAEDAMSLLDSLRADAMHYRRSRHFRYRLLEADAMNKTYRDFTTDSVMLRVVDYYDRHGTANDRLRARYLLGCAYRDLHEAPIALITWEDAIDKADTLSPDCDYATLFRIYGQMAGIYFRQYMPEKELDAQEKFNKYALLAGDTLNYIRGLLLRNDAYLALHDTAAVMNNIKNVRELYLQRGLTQESAQVYPSAIQIALDRKEYAEADSMMQIFETESGLFDEQGNIAPTRERYYYYKGKYYLGTAQLDSAEYQFRRLLHYDDVIIDAYRGLLSLYKQKGNVDSTFKYARLYEDALEVYLESTKTSVIAQAEGMYNYSLHQQIAQEQKDKARRRGAAIIMIVVLGFIAFLYLRHKRKTQEYELQKTTLSYMQAKEELDKLREEFLFLRKHLPEKEESDALLKEKENRIQLLEEMIERYKEKLGREIPQNDEEGLMSSDIVQHFKTICCFRSYKENGIVHTIQPRACDDSEWQKILEAVQKYHYSFYYLITFEKGLPKLQYKVCILSRLGFMTNEIATLLDTSVQNISNARSRVAKRLFNTADTSCLNQDLSKI